MIAFELKKQFYNLKKLKKNFLNMLFLHFRKMPEKGEDNLSLATRINEKRREIKEMDIYLVKEREVVKIP